MHPRFLICVGVGIAIIIGTSGCGLHFAPSSSRDCSSDGSREPASCPAGKAPRCVTCDDDSGREQKSDCGCYDAAPAPAPAPTPAPSMSAPKPLACSGFELRCGEECVDLRYDDANCGLCGNRCAPGQKCDLSLCRAVD